MTYKHLTTRELTLIANFWHQGTKAYQAAKLLKRSQETIYRVYRFLDSGKTIAQYLKAYQRNKQRCGRKQAQLAKDEISYINEQVKAGWTPDTIIGRAERTISCSMRTLYRMFARGQYNFAVQQLPMKGKRHPNGYVERRGKAGLILVDDDAQGAQLKALTANGKFGQAIDFSQKGQSLADLIAALARQHYLVNSTATDNFDYQTGANHQADDAKNQFVIHFVHEKIPTQRTATITRTVHYQYENGQLADDDQVAQQVVTQTGEKIWSRIRNIMISNGRRMLRLKPGDSQVTWVTRPKLMIK